MPNLNGCSFSFTFSFLKKLSAYHFFFLVVLLLLLLIFQFFASIGGVFPWIYFYLFLNYRIDVDLF